MNNLSERVRELRERSLRRHHDLRARPDTRHDFQIAGKQQITFLSSHATEDLEIPHKLGVVPDTVLLGVPSNDARIYRGAKEWTRTAVYLRSSAACVVDVTPVAPDFPRNVFDGSTAIPASSGGGVPVGANPTALVGLSPVNGFAGTFMRSDGAPAIDQTISPTWTGLHTYLRSSDARSIRLRASAAQTANTFEAEYWDAGPGDSFPFFALGAGDGATNFGMVKLGYMGSGDGRAYIQAKLSAAAAADVNAIGMVFDLATTVSAANAFKWTNSSTTKDYFVIGPAGTIVFGYASGLIADPAAAVTMVGTTVNLSTLCSGFATALVHDNTAVTPAAINGVVGLIQVGQANNVPTNGYAGTRGGVQVIIAADSAGANGVELAGLVGLLGTTGFTSSFDRPTGASSLRGNWKRVSSLRGTFIGSKSAGPNLTAGARPLILSGCYAPISPYVDGTTGQAWGVETDAPTSPNTPTVTPIAGGIKIVHPLKNAHANYATRGMHAYFLPYALAAGGFAGNVKGDVSFDDGTNNSIGLWEHDGTAWRYITNDQGLPALGGGAVATLGTIGGGGPAAAAQAGWISLMTSGGLVKVPYWL